MEHETNPLDAAFKKLLSAAVSLTYEEKLRVYNDRVAERKRNESVAQEARHLARDARKCIYAIQSFEGYSNVMELEKARKQLARFEEDIESWLASPIPSPPEEPEPNVGDAA